MKNPLWILNSILIICLLSIIIFISFSIKKITEKVELPNIPHVKPMVSDKEEAFNLKKLKFIEDNDLFGTYKKQEEEYMPKPISIPNIPNPPLPKPILAAQAPQVQFLEPLPIKISGIISSSNESKSQVTLVNNKTSESSSYKIGDKLLDAYILRIFPRKVIVIRSNGQQDTIFMYTEDAEKEIKALKETSWSEIVQKLSNTDFEVNKDNFITRVENVAKLIDMLDLTTAFKNGFSIGCQIGNIESKSIGESLGLLSGDIVLKIADIAPTNTENRISIYDKLSASKHNDIIKMEILRQNKKLVYKYHVKTTQEIKKESKKQTEIALKQEKDILDVVKVINREQNLSLTSKEFKQKDKYAMNKFGDKDAIFKHIKLG